MLNVVSGILSVSGSAPAWVLTLREYFDLLSFAQNACDDAGIATAVEYGYDDERPCIRCVRDQKVPHNMKTQWSRGQIGTDVASLREGDQRANRFVDFLKKPVCSSHIVRSDEL